MKDTAHATSVLNWLRGTAFPAAPTTVYIALIGGVGGDSDFDPKNKSTWTEITTTDCPTYARKAITFLAPAAGTGADAGYMIMVGETIDGSANQFPFPPFNKNVQIDGACICTHATNALSSCGVRAVDAALNTDYLTNQQAAITPSNVKLREQ